jgi:hypothetical protein
MKARGITMIGCAAISCASLFANDGSKSERCLVSTPTRGGDDFDKGLISGSQVQLIRVEPHLRLATVGGEPPSSGEGLPQATPTS